jgi:hypothetical protein
LNAGSSGSHSVGRFSYPFAGVADYVNHSFPIATATALDRLLSADRLAGRMGASPLAMLRSAAVRASSSGAITLLSFLRKPI